MLSINNKRDKWPFQLELLKDISNLIHYSSSYSCVIEEVFQLLLENWQARIGFILIKDQKSKLRTLAWYEDKGQEIIGSRVLPPEIFKNTLEGQSEIMKEVIFKDYFQELGSNTSWLATTPLWIDGKIVGIFGILGEKEGSFQGLDSDILHLISHQISGALEKELQKDQWKNLSWYFNSVLDSLSEGIILISHEKINYCNKKAMNLLCLASDIFYGSYDQIKEQMVEISKESLKTRIYLDTGEALKNNYYTFEIETKEGLFLQITRFKVGEANLRKDCRQLGLLITNISNQKATNNLKDDLIAVVSHELRTPLTSIKGYTSTLLRKDVVWSEVVKQSFLKDIYEECVRLNQLIEKLLDLSKIQAGVVKLDKELIDTRVFINSTINLILHRYPEGLSIEFDLSKGVEIIKVDKQKLSQVLLNLVDNAVKYGHEIVHLEIRIIKKDNMVLFHVKDNGPGITPDLMIQIFKKFHHRNINGGQKGTGLGLAICKGFIEAHGGTIWAESNGYQGSSFYFTLPL